MSTSNWSVERDIAEARRQYYSPKDMEPLTRDEVAKLVSAGVMTFPADAPAPLALLQRRAYAEGKGK